MLITAINILGAYNKDDIFYNHIYLKNIFVIYFWKS